MSEYEGKQTLIEIENTIVALEKQIAQKLRSKESIEAQLLKLKDKHWRVLQVYAKLKH